MPVTFDAPLADTLARLESYNKHLYRPNTYLHKWWARRCGSTFRLILKGLVADPQRRDYYAAGGLEGQVILDPMLGGGTTLHEAIRMGASVVGADLDPIPVLQSRATLSEVPLPALEEGFCTLMRELRRTLAELYATACPACDQRSELQFTLYGQRRSCRCGERVVMDSTVLRQGPGGAEAAICPACLEVSSDPERVESDCCNPHGARLLLEKGESRCGECGAAYEEALHLPYYARYRAAALVGRCAEHGLFFRAPGEGDRARLAEADARREEARFDPEEFRVESGPKSDDLLRRGIRCYLDLFSSRQLLVLRRAADLLPGFEPAVRLNLALLLSTSLEFNSLLCGYKGADRRRPGAVRHAFSHHAYSFPYTALENNPLSSRPTSGTLAALFRDRIVRGRQWARRPVERRVEGGWVRTVAIAGEVDAGTEVTRPADLRAGPRRFMLAQSSSTALPLADESVDHVVTDPPYYDSVQYSDLAAFFRVWLRQFAPEAAEWRVELAGSAVDSGEPGSDRYARLLGGIFAECRRVLKKERGTLIFTFHHWKPAAWAALTLALRRPGFRLAEFHVVHAENPSSVHVVNLKALVHDAILVLRPLEAGPGPAWPRPEPLDTEDSEAFCRGCAGALGWMLGKRESDEQVKMEWTALLAAQ